MKDPFRARCGIAAAFIAVLAGRAGALSVGDKTACAIESATGRLRCWGKAQASVSATTEGYYIGNGDLKVPPELLLGGDRGLERRDLGLLGRRCRLERCRLGLERGDFGLLCSQCSLKRGDLGLLGR